MRSGLACIVGIGAAFVASAASADGLYRTNTGPGGADFSGFKSSAELGEDLHGLPVAGSGGTLRKPVFNFFLERGWNQCFLVSFRLLHFTGTSAW